MPCECRGMGESSEAQLRKELNRVTDMLCRTCQRCDENGVSLGGKDTVNWWEDHKKADMKAQAAARKAAELKEIQKKALAKLTPAERRALGVCL